MRMLPYRTTDNVIDGLVVTFVDITKIKGLQEDWRRLILALGSAPTAIFGQTADLTYDWAFGNILGQRAEHMIGRTDQDVFAEGDGRVLTDLKREVIAPGKSIRRRIPLGFDGARRIHDIFSATDNFRSRQRDHRCQRCIDGVAGGSIKGELSAR